MKHKYLTLFVGLLLIHVQPLICAQSDTISKHQLSTTERVSGILYTPNSYYNVIIDNNIFRPLGWQHVPEIIPYQLIGAVTYPDKEREAYAILQETAAEKKIHYVVTGDAIGDIKVIDIQPKQVTLNKVGENKVFKITQQFLNPPRNTWNPRQEIEKQTDKKPQAKIKSQNKKLSSKNMRILEVTKKHGRINPPPNGIIFRFQ